MCTFIAVAVAGYRGDARQSFTERHLAAHELTGGFAEKMPAGTHFSITDGHCACSVYPRPRTATARDPDDERRRYQRKGWSQSKIERAIESRRVAHARLARSSSQPDLAKCFIEAISHLVTSGARVTLLAHFFRGGFDEVFELAGVQRTPLGLYLEKHGEFPEDTLVTIAA